MTIESHNDRISSLVQTFRRDDPRLADILEFIAGDLHNVITTVSPIQELLEITLVTGDQPPADVSAVVVIFLDRAILIAWSPVTGAQFYEIREGATWDAATFVLKTPSLSAALEPKTANTYNMLIKAIASNGLYSDDAFAFDIVIEGIDAPSMTAQVIDNNVLLYWTIPTTVFKIDYYIVYRDTVEFARISGNFLTRFEVLPGTYLYEVEAVDIAGTVSAKGSISASVREPPDYVLEGEYLPDYSLGTIVNGKVDASGALVVCIDVAETITAHFTSEGYLDPEDQVTGGWARWIQENLITGSYEEKKDFAPDAPNDPLENTIVNVTYVKEEFAGCSDVAVVVQMNVSDDDIAWAGWTEGASQFFVSFRYLKFKLEFTGANDDAMVAISSLKVALNIKKEVDSGVMTADKTDGSGTPVTFTKAFKDVDSVTAECDAVEPLTAIVDFTDVPNPTGFVVYVFDTKGQRVDAIVYWKARGVV